MISAESLIIVLFIIVTLLIMGVWGLIRMYIGEKAAKNIGELLRLDIKRKWQEQEEDLELLVDIEEKYNRALVVLQEKREECDEHYANWEDMHAKLCLTQDRLAVAVSELGDAQQGWKECSDQLGIESEGLETAHATIERLTAELAGER